MTAPSPLGRIARRLGVDRNRSLLNASPDPVRRARDRHDQYQAIRQRMDPFPDGADARSPQPALDGASVSDA